MTPEQFVAVLGAIAALIAAIAGLSRQLHSIHIQINSRMDQLLAVTAKSSRAEGVVAGKEQGTVE